MDEPRYRLFPRTPGGPTLDNIPRGFTVTAGTPRCTTWRHYSDQDGLVLTASGVWECTEGTFAFRFQHWEFFRILQGDLVITPEAGAPMALSAGDAMVMEPGFAGTWEVRETMRKHFVTRYVAP